MHHPWHDIPIDRAPEEVPVYIECVPQDTVKYELDKTTGFLKVDRPHKFSSLPPHLYGFVPRTYSGENVARIWKEETGKDVKGDGDPLDIFVLCSCVITHGVIVNAIPIGGLRMLDQGEADDKIVAIMKSDPVYGKISTLEELPEVCERLEHYLVTYKGVKSKVSIDGTYGPDEARKVIEASMVDYCEFKCPRPTCTFLEL